MCNFSESNDQMVETSPSLIGEDASIDINWFYIFYIFGLNKFVLFQCVIGFEFNVK